MRTGITLVAICAAPVPSILFVVMHWLWLVPGTGEANFLFFQALAYNAFVGLLAIEFTGASLRRDKALRMTEKQLRLRKEQEVEPTEKGEHQKDEDLNQGSAQAPSPAHS
jgi:hypothetical protein